MFRLADPTIDAERLREIDVANENLLDDEEDVEVDSCGHKHKRPGNKFTRSAAHVKYLNFVLALNNSVKGKQNKDVLATPASPAVVAVEELVGELSGLIERAPPIDTASRFGNAGFRDYIDLVTAHCQERVGGMLAGGMSPEQIAEAGTYLANSLGNARRIDYGTGHEMNFVCFLYCLCEVGFVTESDHAALVVRVFQKYLLLVRVLQSKYCLEPAGSRGVWGLDDFHFLPFLWGSSQLLGHRFLKPKSVLVQETLDAMAPEYLYFSCIRHIHEAKVCSFAEHSPLLHDITLVKTWDKVNSGFIKMYKADVLAKNAVVQHFIYSSFLPSDEHPDALVLLAESLQAEEEKRAKLVAHHCDPDKQLPCCTDTLRIPSAAAANKN